MSPGFIGSGFMWDRQVELRASVPSQYYADTIDEVAQQMIVLVPLRRHGSLDEVAGAVLFRRLRFGTKGPNARAVYNLGSNQGHETTPGGHHDRSTHRSRNHRGGGVLGSSC